MISCWPENPQTLLIRDTLEFLTDHLQIKTECSLLFFIAQTWPQNHDFLDSLVQPWLKASLQRAIYQIKTSSFHNDSVKFYLNRL